MLTATARRACRTANGILVLETAPRARATVSEVYYVEGPCCGRSLPQYCLHDSQAGFRDTLPDSPRLSLPHPRALTDTVDMHALLSLYCLPRTWPRRLARAATEPNAPTWRRRTNSSQAFR